MSADRVMIVFSCLHTFMFPRPAPRMGEQLWCPTCNKAVHAMEAPHDYSAACVSCGDRKEFGNAALTADVWAVKHSLRRAGHRVVVYDGLAVMGEHFNPPIPMSTAPPF
jgi:hypothetical protein